MHKSSNVRRWSVLAAAIFASASFVAPAYAQAPAADLFSRLDVNEDGVLSGLEAKTVSARDADGDGRVTRTEFAAVATPPGGSAAEDAKLFAERDVTEDGFLSGKEMKGLEAYDTDKDGEVTKDEFMRARAAHGPRTPAANEATNAANDALATFVAAAQKRAQILFRNLDANEDDRLSGTEIVEDFKEYDVNRDARITRDEFMIGMLGPAAAAALKNAPVKIDPKIPLPAGPSGHDMALLIAPLQTGNVKPLLDAMGAEMRAGVDEPILKFWFETLRAELGDVVPPRDEEVTVVNGSRNGTQMKESKAEVSFARGKATFRIATSGKEVVGMKLDTPLADEMNDKLYRRLVSPAGQEMMLQYGKFFAPLGQRMLELISANKDKEAFECFYPAVQKELGFEAVKAYFDKQRLALGDVKKIEWNGLTCEFDDQGKPKPNFIIEYDLTTENGPVTAKISMQPVGFKVHLIRLQMTKTEP